MLLFQLSAAERCTFFDNFLADPRVPKATKDLDSLADVAGMLVNDYYKDMKKKITNEEHKRWGSLPLSKRHIEYTTKDTYTAYEIWNHITLTQDGLAQS
ncbi:hypothetical protein D1007_24650 [Hordeum vulgare]|nr:hypothetical protein D1007_24650 [Hordeum vulgare]